MKRKTDQRKEVFILRKNSQIITFVLFGLMHLTKKGLQLQ